MFYPSVSEKRFEPLFRLFGQGNHLFSGWNSDELPRDLVEKAGCLGGVKIIGG
jgi:hypothetical protein